MSQKVECLHLEAICAAKKENPTSSEQLEGSADVDQRQIGGGDC